MKNNISLVLISLFLTLFSVTQLTAASVNITYLGGGGTDYSTNFENLLSSDLKDIDSSKFNSYLSNSGAIALRGLGMDFADTSFKYVNLSFTTSVGMAPISAIDKLRKGQMSIFAVAPAMSVSLGLDMHYVKVPILKDFKFFVNFFYFDATSLVKPLLSQINQAKTVSFGLHFLYPIIKGKSVVSKHLLHWGGLNVSGGLDYLGTDLSFVFPLTNNGITLNPKLALSSKVFSLPIEVTTNVRLIHILSLFVGVGTDFNFGVSHIAVSAPNFTATDGGKYKVDADLGKKKAPHFMSLRLLAGVQINLWAFKFFANTNYSFTANALSANFGLRFSL